MSATCPMCSASLLDGGGHLADCMLAITADTAPGASLEEQHTAVLRGLTGAIDDYLNPARMANPKAPRLTAFVLLTFPVKGDKSADSCSVTSNVTPSDLPRLLTEVGAGLAIRLYTTTGTKQ